ncbi:hypothetical protein QNY04_000283 [Escherichia coli]|nr:hypothetical protein [Escherichia coli]ELV4051625.1 hypothetical protein [Escherichia coli]MCZ5457858.1 hypothetical protein [Escherichia coli]HDI6025767.1 hypothetical protein [Escherichia coli]
MGQFSTNSYVNERKQPKNGLNNCPTNNGANDTENNEKTSTRQIIEHPHSPLIRKWFFQRFCAALGLLSEHITISAVFVNNPILRLLSFNHCWTPRAFLQVKRIFALRFFIVLLSCVSLLHVVPLQYRYGASVPG